MTDVLTSEQRHKCMSRIRGRDTKPEVIVRKLVHRLGYRFRLHSPNLLGKPDLILPRLNKVIFVHGCFWHLHCCKYGKVIPATNTAFWSKKREGNRERDRRVLRLIRKAGWSALVVWECQTKDRDKLALRLAVFLRERNPRQISSTTGKAYPPPGFRRPPTSPTTAD